MENLTLELGSSRPFWDLDFSTWGCLATPSWITYTWRDLCSTDLTLRGPHTLIPLQRHGDVFLMDVFVSQGFTSEQIRTLNKVRMYKQVIRLSNITTADGISIALEFLNSQPPVHPTPFIWPQCA